MCVRVAKAQSQELGMLDKHSTTELESPSPTSAQFWYDAYTPFSRISLQSASFTLTTVCFQCSFLPRIQVSINNFFIFSYSTWQDRIDTPDDNHRNWEFSFYRKQQNLKYLTMRKPRKYNQRASHHLWCQCKAPWECKKGLWTKLRHWGPQNHKLTHRAEDNYPSKEAIQRENSRFFYLKNLWANT